MSLAVKQLSAGYTDTLVISGIDMEVTPGRICALMGRNGSGKTTLLRCINGILKPMSGSVSVMGNTIAGMNRKRIAGMISVVPQVSGSPFSFSCLDMVLMAGVSRIRAWGAPSGREKEKARAVLAETGIEKMAHRPFNTLSGGEKQLVMLARALFQDTPVMLLDEPNSHLDFPNQHHIMSLMLKLVKEKKKTAVISLHDPNLVHNYCDDVVLIHKGSIAAKGAVRSTLTDDVLQKVLGNNIQSDVTSKGQYVVTPKIKKSPVA